jgi:hypothetical protein
MKNLFIIIILVTIGFTANTRGQANPATNPITTAGGAEARLVTPISFVQNTPMNFGSILLASSGAASMQLSVGNDGSVTMQSSNTAILEALTSPRDAGTFTMTAEEAVPLQITISNGLLTRTGETGDTNEISLTHFTVKGDTGSQLDDFVINSGGIEDAVQTTAITTFNTGPGTAPGRFYIGATLNVSSGQNSGNYAGNYNVELAYY